jgi:hypothetical protein
MPEQSNHEFAVELASFKAEVRADIKNLATSVEEIKSGMNGVMLLREDLAKFSIHHEQFRSEARTMWTRIDEQRDEIRDVAAQMNHWKGAIRMAGAIATVVATIAGAVLTWTWMQVSAVPVLSEKVKQLETRGK